MNVFIDIDIFKSDLIDIDIFKTCRYIDNRYGLSIYRTPLEEWELGGMEIGNKGYWEEWEVGNGGTEEKVGRARENPHPAFQNAQNYQCFLTYTSISEISHESWHNYHRASY